MPKFKIRMIENTTIWRERIIEAPSISGARVVADELVGRILDSFEDDELAKWTEIDSDAAFDVDKIEEIKE